MWQDDKNFQILPAYLVLSIKIAKVILNMVLTGEPAKATTSILFDKHIFLWYLKTTYFQSKINYCQTVKLLKY